MKKYLAEKVPQMGPNISAILLLIVLLMHNLIINDRVSVFKYPGQIKCGPLY